MKKTVLVLLLALLVAAVTAAPAGAVTPLRPAPTPPDTDSVLILHGAFNYPGYWWDHTDLTVAVQAHPNVDEESLTAVHQAIADWDYALRQEFGGLITLTDVTDQYTAKHKADIVLHYNPTAGGTVFGGYAICGANSCPNVIVRSDLVPPVGVTYTPQYLYYVTMHELGHALGLGHALLLESLYGLLHLALERGEHDHVAVDLRDDGVNHDRLALLRPNCRRGDEDERGYAHGREGERHKFRFHSFITP